MNRQRAAAALAALSLMLCGCSAAPKEAPETTAATLSQTAEPEWGRTVSRDGKTWRYNSRLTTVLFMGVDSHETDASEVMFGSGGRADMVCLLVLDPDSSTTRIVMLSRDTITDVDVYSPDNELMFTTPLQLTMQYSVGSSPSRSCRLMRRTVSRTLLDLPIASHCSMTLDGIGAAAEYFGGITLTLEEDWSAINPAYTAGATITMDAKQAEYFLRWRDVETTGSNDTRIRRHSAFLRAMFSQIGQMSRPELEKLLEHLAPWLETDMDAETVSNLTKFTVASEVEKIPGQTVLGDAGHDEFHIDTEKMKDLLIRIFYREK